MLLVPTCQLSCSAHGDIYLLVQSVPLVPPGMTNSASLYTLHNSKVSPGCTTLWHETASPHQSYNRLQRRRVETPRCPGHRQERSIPLPACEPLEFENLVGRTSFFPNSPQSHPIWSWIHNQLLAVFIGRQNKDNTLRPHIWVWGFDNWKPTGGIFILSHSLPSTPSHMLTLFLPAPQWHCCPVPLVPPAVPPSPTPPTHRWKLRARLGHAGSHILKLGMN